MMRLAFPILPQIGGIYTLYRQLRARLSRK